jgi:hypothetical protein
MARTPACRSQFIQFSLTSGVCAFGPRHAGFSSLTVTRQRPGRPSFVNARTGLGLCSSEYWDIGAKPLRRRVREATPSRPTSTPCTTTIQPPASSRKFRATPEVPDGASHPTRLSRVSRPCVAPIGGGQWIVDRSTTGTNSVDAVETRWTAQQARGLRETSWTETATLPRFGVAGSNPVFRSKIAGQSASRLADYFWPFGGGRTSSAQVGLGDDGRSV